MKAQAAIIQKWKRKLINHVRHGQIALGYHARTLPLYVKNGTCFSVVPLCLYIFTLQNHHVKKKEVNVFFYVIALNVQGVLFISKVLYSTCGLHTYRHQRTVFLLHAVKLICEACQLPFTVLMVLLLLFWFLVCFFWRGGGGGNISRIKLSEGKRHMDALFV